MVERTNGSPEAVHSATKIFAITPSDSEAVAGGFTRAIRCAAAGDLCVVGMDDTAPTVIPDIIAGETLQIAVRKVMATGTTVPPDKITGYR